jgi:aryl-alcohol dehydrogenase-like predicted oxidoreductase
MQNSRLGKTGIEVSRIAFGAGPIADLMTSPDRNAEQFAVVDRAIELGINWFDTAATYGEGHSEEALGRVLKELGAADRVHVATKVRIPPDRCDDMRSYIRQSVENSLRRLRLPRVTLLQLHNSITAVRGAQPTSVTPSDVLGPIADTFHELRETGLIKHIGITGLGEPAPLAQVLKNGPFETIQTPYHLLNPSSGREMLAEFQEQDLRNLFRVCQEKQIGVFTIRVFAGGALGGKPPSKHTLTTPFFPLALYERDQARAEALRSKLPSGITLPELAVRFALSHNAVSAAILGFASPDEVEAAVAFAARGGLSPELLNALC